MTDSAVIHLAALAGYDFVLLDAEHAGMSLETVANHVHAARAYNLGTLMRVPQGDAAYVQRALDMGVEGIEFPHIKTAADAEWAASILRFPPDGTRGMFTKGLVADYGLHGFSSVNELARAVNGEIVCEIIIEDVEGVENIDAIVEVAGIDLVCVGSSDLMGSLNLIGQPEHPAVREATETVYAAARRANLRTHVPSIGLAGWSKEDLDASGLWMISSSSDAGAMLAGMQADLRALPDLMALRSGSNA
jgi:4-hydroxy-2-oxoheptanedioate aldolase